MILEFKKKNEPDHSDFMWIRCGMYFDWNANANKDIWKRVLDLMDENIRLNVSYELGFCKNRRFIDRYCEVDDEFEEVLYNSFGIHKVDK